MLKLLKKILTDDGVFYLFLDNGLKKCYLKKNQNMR